MHPATGARSLAGPGFTLVELLLTVTLLGLFIGALVFNFADFGEAGRFDEGASRFETLLRLAQAEASFTGRQVRVRFEEDSQPDSTETALVLRFEWEPEPLESPGVFSALEGDPWQTQPPTDSLRIGRVSRGSLADSEEAQESPADVSLDDLESGELPAVVFYPDGSADALEIELAPLALEDPRRIIIQINGVTGTIHRRRVALGGEDAEAEPKTEPDAGATAGGESRAPAEALPGSGGGAPVVP